MKQGFDTTLLSSGEMMRKGYSSLVANMGKTIAIITLLVATVVSFTEIGFCDVTAASFTSTLIMMLIASYIMYFSLEDAGEKLGRENEEYGAVLKEYNDRKKKISGSDIVSLRSFCLRYRQEELEYRKSNILFSEGYTREEYDAYKNGAFVSKKTRRVFKKIDRMRRAELTAMNLLSRDVRSGASELKNPEKWKVLSLFIRMIPSTVCMIFTVSVMISTRDNLTVGAIIECILKLATLPIIGLRGYTAGYEYVTKSETAWLQTKTNLLDAFLNEKVS